MGYGGGLPCSRAGKSEENEREAVCPSGDQVHLCRCPEEGVGPASKKGDLQSRPAAL